MTIKNIFCAQDQEITAQVLSVDTINGEIIATCPCGRFLKFPSNVTKDSFNDMVAEHHGANEGQVSLADTEALVETLGDDTSILGDTTVEG